MHRIFTYMFVRNLPKINIECIYKKKPIINKPIIDKPINITNPNLVINKHTNYDFFYLCSI